MRSADSRARRRKRRITSLPVLYTTTVHYWKVAAIVASGLVIFGRAPQLFFEPRLWAEEVTVYLERGLALSWAEGLWLSDSGYINLLANMVGVLAAHTVPLAYAPVIALVVSFVIMLLPVVLVMTAENVWENVWAQAAAVAVILLAVPNQEVWLNSITSQFHLSLCAGIILALPAARSVRVRWLHRVVVGLAAIGGAASVLLAPLFWVRAWQEKSKERVLQAAVLSSVVIIQLLVAAQYGLGNHAIKFVPGLAWLTLMIKDVLLPFLGSEATGNLISTLTRLALAGISAVVIAGFLALWSSKLSGVRWLLAAALALGLMSLIFSLDAPPRLVSALVGNRYFMAPNVLWQLALVAWVFRPKVRWPTARSVGGAVLAWLLLVGAWEYVHVDQLFFEGPSWRAEIQAWQSDQSRLIHLWPRPWTWQIPEGYN